MSRAVDLANHRAEGRLALEELAHMGFQRLLFPVGKPEVLNLTKNGAPRREAGGSFRARERGEDFHQKRLLTSGNQARSPLKPSSSKMTPR